MRKLLPLVSALFTCFFLHSQTNEVRFLFQPIVNGDSLHLNQTLFQIWNGKTLRLDRAEFYISEISLLKPGGGKVSLNGQYILSDAGEPETVWSLGSTSLDQIEGVELYIGVDPDHNHLDPTTYPLGHPLGLQDPSMHWGWSAGYRFMAIEGYVDNNNDGNPESLFQYHNLGDNLYKKTTVLGSVSAEGGILTVPFQVDYARLFEDMSLVGNLIHHGSDSQNAKMLDNASSKGFLTIALPTPTSEVEDHSASVSIWPNPVSGLFILHQDLDVAIDLVDIRILDMFGRLVIERRNVPARSDLEIELSGQVPGNYVVGIFHQGALIARQPIMVH